MRPLLVLIDSKGNRYACGESCYLGYRATKGCICGGANSDVGRAKARRCTLKNWKRWTDRWIEDHPEVEIVMIDLMGLRSDPQQMLTSLDPDHPTSPVAPPPRKPPIATNLLYDPGIDTGELPD